MGWTTSARRVPAESRPETETEIPSAWGWLTGSDLAPSVNPAQQEYCPRELPIPMRKAPVAPWVRDLSRLLDTRPAFGEPLPSLRRVEHALRTRSEAAHLLPESLLRGAASELRWIARRSTASPALARLLDRFETELMAPARLARAKR